MERAAPPLPALRVVEAGPEHLDGIAEIYAAVVHSSPATFDIEPPQMEHWRRALAAVDPKLGYHLLVALGADGDVLGFARSGRYKERAAYATTCETSIYIAAHARRAGVGSALYARLFELLDASPLRLATAGVTEPNEASTALHRAVGFQRVGTFTDVGIKFGRPWSVTWYERPLGGSSAPAGR
jgi:L-amino acid N-acyltransferase YncA